MRRRRWIAVLLVGALIVAVAAIVAVREISSARCFVLTGEAVCRVESDAPLVALTFDDGPTSVGVENVLPILERHGARATFFLIGQEMERRPGLARRIAGAGHEIANHSYSHARMVGRSARSYDSEIARTAALLQAEGATGARLFRPPFGKKLYGLPRAAARNGHRLIMWDVEEPATSDHRRYAEAVLREVRPGSIILMHVMYRANAPARDALPLILAGLQARGLRAVTVSELLAAAR